MATEREILRDSLEPNNADWVAYRQEVLGRRKDCSSLSELLAFAGGKLTAEKAASVDVHQKNCSYCQGYVSGYLAGKCSALGRASRVGGNAPATIAETIV
jgi:hypothetical protein